LKRASEPLSTESTASGKVGPKPLRPMETSRPEFVTTHTESESANHAGIYL